jgi:molybdenum cofactor cytidylyltransferase
LIRVRFHALAQPEDVEGCDIDGRSQLRRKSGCDDSRIAAERRPAVLIFGITETSGAAGAILAHTTHLPGGALKKGLVLQPGHIAALLEAGFATILVARLEPGDMSEDEAAARLATALCAPGFQLRLPGTGRANVLAACNGLFRASAAKVDALNGIDDSITLGTLPDATPVRKGELVATVKIIPFAAPETAIDRAASLAVATPPLRLATFRPHLAGLVLTTLPGLKQAVLEATAATMQGRIARLSGRMLPPLECAHATPDIAAALRTLLARGADLLLIAGASAVADRNDVAPAGIAAAGGEILHFGMPVDPGNLLCLGRIGDIPALVLPGCARSPALNGIDFVLARIVAGEPIGPKEIRRMGVGGLVKEFRSRPAPRQSIAQS